MIKVTEYERIACVSPTQMGQFSCPKCCHTVNERSPEKRSEPKIRREWDCPGCGRGWIAVPAWVRTIADAFQVAENEMEAKQE